MTVGLVQRIFYLLQKHHGPDMKNAPPASMLKQFANHGMNDRSRYSTNIWMIASSSWNVGRQRVVVVAALLLLLVASSSSSSASRAGTTDDGDDAELQTLLRRAHEMISQDTTNDKNNDGSSNNAGAEYKAIWKRIRKLKPRWAEANARYGMILLGTPHDQKNAIELLRRSIDIRHVDDPIPLNSPQGLIFATTVGRYYHSIDRTVRAIPIIDDAYNANHDDLCLALMSSTMILHQVPTSMEKEDEIVGEYLIRTNAVLTRLTQQQTQTRQSQTPEQSQSQSLEKWTMDEQYLSRTFPGAASDPYEHCMINIFYLSFYYRANVALVASRYYQLAINVWPDLNYISQRALQYQQQQQQQDGIPPTNSNVVTNDDDKDDDDKDLIKGIIHLETIVANQTKEIQKLRRELRNAGIQIDENDDNNNIALHSSVNDDHVNNNTMKKKKEIVKRKIRLGIVSPNLSKKHSVVEDFKGTMTRLDRSKFDITYIFIQEGRNPNDNDPDPFVYEHSPRDKLLVLQQDVTIDIANGAWVTRWHNTIENLQFDILFYLDLTMGGVTTRLAMSKLAPVQVVSHGHPVTSGIPSSIMDYYISWGLAELEYDIANTHYTEELKLLPTKSIHQYYTPRATRNKSLINGENYRILVNAGRDEAFPTIPSTGNWYTCMQKPFKLFPEMDALICGIIRKDNLGRVILHGAATEPQRIFTNRLLAAGCDMKRVHFLGAQPHHQLLALYALSDVILDSYPAGGCTTTREVLAIGKALVTLPARLLGGRWSYAYYQIMGDEILNSLVIAKNASEYITLAVTLGTSIDIRNDVERRIKNSVPALYEREESVKAWNEVFLDISPVIIDENYDYSTNNGAIDKDEL